MDTTDGVCTDTYVYDADCLTLVIPDLPGDQVHTLPATGAEDPTATVILSVALIIGGLGLAFVSAIRRRKS